MRTAHALCIVGLVAGCGRLAFDERPPGDDGDASTGDGTGGDAGTGPCNLIERLGDDFEDGTLADWRWGNNSTDPGTMAAENGGTLILTPATNAAPFRHVARRTSRFYDLHESRYSAEVVEVTTGTAATGLAVDHDGQSTMTVVYMGGMLRAQRKVSGALAEPAAIPYNAVAHRFWGISEHAGRIYWEASPDGVTWTSFYDEPPQFPVDLVRGSLGASTNGAEPTPGQAQFAAVNGGGIAGVACSAASFTERFDGTTDLHAWENSYMNGASSYSIGGGHLTFTGDATGVYAGFGSSAGYDLRGQAISMTIVTPPSPTSGYTLALAVEYDNNNSFDVYLVGTTLYGREVVNGVTDNQSITWNPTMTHVRIREASGLVYWETSSDGVLWNNSVRPPVAVAFPVDDLIVTVNAGRANVVDTVAVDDVGGN